MQPVAAKRREDYIKTCLETLERYFLELEKTELSALMGISRKLCEKPSEVFPTEIIRALEPILSRYGIEMTPPIYFQRDYQPHLTQK